MIAWGQLRVLVGKLLRDVRTALVLTCLLLMLFQCLWAKITQRIVGELVPYFRFLAGGTGQSLKNVAQVLFAGPGKIVQTLMGGESIELDRAMHMLSIGYVHPLMVTVFCVWAIGRAAGAIAGEIDRGTMELLMSQPMPRARLVLAHLLVDAITIPILCLSLWGGNWLGKALTGPIEAKPPPALALPIPLPAGEIDPAALETDPWAFLRALPSVGALVFAVSGLTMALSAAGRFRWRVLGVAVFVALGMFLVNVMGQMWEEGFGWARPLTVFYYYQPQALVLGRPGGVDLAVWNGGRPLVHLSGAAVLFVVGALGYALALATFQRRDLPPPL